MTHVNGLFANHVTGFFQTEFEINSIPKIMGNMANSFCFFNYLS